MADIDKNYKLRGLYFEEFQMSTGEQTLIPVEILVPPEEVLYINQLKANPGADEYLVHLRHESWGGLSKSVDIARAKSIIQGVIKEHMVFSFAPITSYGMTPENWERVRKRQLLIKCPKNTGKAKDIQSPIIWLNPIPELLKDPRFVCCGDARHEAPSSYIDTSRYPINGDCQPAETNLIFYSFQGKDKIIRTSWVNKDLVDTAYSALKTPACKELSQYSLYFKGCRQAVHILRKNELYESAMKEIFQGRRTHNEHYVKLPGYYDALHLSNIREIRWKKINGLFYIVIRLKSNEFTKIYWKTSLQFVKKMKKTDDTIEKWMETSGIKLRFFRKINEYIYINRHGGREKDEKSESAA